MIAVLIVGVAAQNAAVILLGFAIGVVSLGAQLWSKLSLRRLFYERIVSEDHAFPGEEIGVTLRVNNRKALPLPWIDVRDAFPESMNADAPDLEIRPIHQSNQTSVEWMTSAGPYEKVSRAYGLRAPARGIYYLGPASIRTGDPFGLFPEQRSGLEPTKLTVYPRPADIGEHPIPSRRPFGENVGGLRIFEDPSRVSGMRDYQPGDSLRRIDWNATARLGKLQSRVYDPTTSHHLFVCLNTATMTPSWAGFMPELFEGAITIAASLALQAHDERYAVGLLATSSVADADESIRISPSRAPEQLIRVLEALAVVTPYVLDSLAAMIDREEHRMAVGTTLAIVTATMPEELVVTLQRLRRRGHRLFVLSPSGNRWQNELEGIDVRHIDLPGITQSMFARPAGAAR
jgi:uncharacterized protein (DUF58 family)